MKPGDCEGQGLRNVECEACIADARPIATSAATRPLVFRFVAVNARSFKPGPDTRALCPGRSRITTRRLTAVPALTRTGMARSVATTRMNPARTVRPGCFAGARNRRGACEVSRIHPQSRSLTMLTPWNLIRPSRDARLHARGDVRTATSHGARDIRAQQARRSAGS